MSSLITLFSVLLMGATVAWMSGTRWARRMDWPIVWEMLKYIFPPTIRGPVYEPGHKELLKDYNATRAYRRARSCHMKWAWRWLWICFAVRTLLLIAACCHAILAGLPLKLVPDRLRRWWRTEPRNQDQSEDDVPGSNEEGVDDEDGSGD
ncbi:MAG: hypothetical protein ACLP9L_24010 [Thermoguttaceae bacterium]